MSKGFEPPKEFSRFKKPKLDVNVNVNKINKLPTFRSMDSNDQPNLWDDDDDDVILFATQAAEMQQTPAEPSTSRQQNVNPTQISFSEFGTNLGATSTQRPVLAEPMPMFEDDDDEAFKCLSPNNFDVKQPDAEIQEQQLLRMQNAERRLSAADQQLKLLTNQMQALKNCNKNLNAELATSKENMQIKSGEAALLRDELKNLKQEVQRLKMAKMLSEENARKKCQTQIEELQRAVEARNAQLQLKSAEFASLKMRHADETKRWEDSFCMTQEPMAVDVEPSTSKVLEKPAEDEDTDEFGGMSLCVLQDDDLWSDLLEVRMCFVNMLREPNICDYKFEKLTTAHVEHMKLQALLGRYLTCRLVANKSKIETEIIQSTKIVLLDFWNYVQSLTYKKHDTYYASLDYTQIKDIPTLNNARRLALLQPDALIEQERALVLRRYIASLAYACGAHDTLARKLLAEKYENMLLLQVLSICIEKLSYAEQICEHSVLLEAISELLHALICLPKKAQIVRAERMEEEAVTIEDYWKDFKFEFKMPPTTSDKMTTEQAQVLNEEITACALNIQKIDLNKFNIDFSPVIENIDQVASQAPIVLKEMGFEEKEVKLTVELPAVTPLETEEVLAEMFKQLIFTRPGIRVLLSLSCILSEAARKHPSFVDKLCVNSCADSFKYVRENEVFKFTSKSCVLQVYANLLISAFPLYTTLMHPDVKLLHAISIKHMEFVLKCFIKKPKFFKTALCAYVDSLDNETSTDSGAYKDEPQCSCYITLNLSVMKLAYKVMYQWIHTYKKETQEVYRVSNIAVYLLHVIFCQYYITRFFRNDGDKTRNTLYLLCKWWQVNAKTLGFGEMNSIFLRKLQKSHIMPKQMNEYVNVHNIVEDSDKLHVLTNGATKDISGINISNEKAAEEIWQEFTDPTKFFGYYVKDNAVYQFVE